MDDKSMAGLEDSKASMEIKSEEQKPAKEPMEVSEWNKSSSKDVKIPDTLQDRSLANIFWANLGLKKHSENYVP